MENASKALLMAAGVLIGILVLSLIVTLFISSKGIFDTYEKTKKSDEVQRFNVNFTKYLGKDLTIHEVVTISNFAEENGVKVNKSYGLKNIVESYQGSSIVTYRIIIDENSYSDEGYIKSISFN